MSSSSRGTVSRDDSKYEEAGLGRFGCPHQFGPPVRRVPPNDVFAPPTFTLLSILPEIDSTRHDFDRREGVNQGK